jgi:MOSC domain-containing protein YiiM
MGEVIGKDNPASSSGRIVQISVSAGGVPKHAVQAARVTTEGVEGDAHRDLRHHGGPERALCIFSMERIRALQSEGHPITPGSIGENVTIEGLHWTAVAPGTRLQLGEGVLVEVTRYTTPCANISRSFRDGDPSRVAHHRHPDSSRVYARVLREGSIRCGDSVRLEPGTDHGTTPDGDR